MLLFITQSEIYMKSMTGYGKGVVELNNKKCTIEIKSVNHRFLDLSFKMPKVFSCFEDCMRKAIASKIARGHLDIFVTYEAIEGEDKNLVFNDVVANKYVEIAKRIELEYSLPNDMTVISLMKCPYVVEVGVSEEDEEELKTMLLQSLYIALDGLVKMRESEGENLKKSFLGFLSEIESVTKNIEKKAPEVSEEYKENLRKRVLEYLDDIPVDEARLLNEVAVYSDRVCIDEEITRLLAHVKHMREMFDKQKPIGRDADFLVQEFNRESNTIASKSNNLVITGYALELKSIIEKMREQVQNIE